MHGFNLDMGYLPILNIKVSGHMTEHFGTHIEQQQSPYHLHRLWHSREQVQNARPMHEGVMYEAHTLKTYHTHTQSYSQCTCCAPGRC
eukprot:scaffold209149_cov17-Tisochrysis_lutea.AAC.2